MPRRPAAGQPGHYRRPTKGTGLSAVKPTGHGGKAGIKQLAPFVLLGVAAAATSILPSEQCKDRSPMCAEWVSRGECGNNPDFMLEACGAACGHCRKSAGRMHRRLAMVTDYGLGPLYLALSLLSCAVSRQGHDISQDALAIYVVQVVATGAVLPWTALGCAAFYCHGALAGSNFAFAASGFASGMCGFIGALVSMVELGEV